MEYKYLELQFLKEAPNQYIASASVDGSIGASQSFELRTGELKNIEKLQLLEKIAVKPEVEETFHIDFGKELYNKVFAGELGGYLKKCIQDVDNETGLRICLRFDENTQEIAAHPWEFLHDGEKFLVTNRNVLISRLPMGIRKVESKPLESILRMLVVISNPEDPNIAPLNIYHEQEVILEAVDQLQQEHKMEIDFTEDASFETIQGYLNEKDYHIIHFTGHGAFTNGKGYLILEKEDGSAKAVDNRTVAELITGRDIRLVVLSNCQSGKVSNKEAFTDMASTLTKENIPAIVAMQYSILDSSATKFASTFYQTIAKNKPVDVALTEARIVMKNYDGSNGVDFATPMLYLSDPDCVAVGNIQPEAPEHSTESMMLPELQIMEKGFIGRRKELRLLQKGFKSDNKRAAIIYGFGGIGKTVLASRLGLMMLRHFEGIFGIKCKSTTTPDDILNELSTYFKLAGINVLNQIIFEPVPLAVKTIGLTKIFNQHRYLIILDNFEDCLNEQKNDIENPELKGFIQQLLNNTKSGTKFIITTRYNFYPLEGRLPESIEHLSVPELPFPQSVWVMNNYTILKDLSIKKKYEIYKKIGGHPWTIGQFAKHASDVSVDILMLELEPLKQDLINFTLLDKSYSRLNERTRALLLRNSVYKNSVPVVALSWMMGDEHQPNPKIIRELKTLLDWGLISKERFRDTDLYSLHTLVKEFAEQEINKEGQDKKKLLIRAAQYYEKLVKQTRDLWDLLKAREYYYEAEEWKKAYEIVSSTYKYLVRWGHIELVKNLLNQSIKTNTGIEQVYARGSLANLHYGLGNIKIALEIYNEITDVFEKIGDKSGIANTLGQLGNMHYSQGNYEEAVKLYQQSNEIFEELGDKGGIANTLHQLGMIHYSQGNYKEAVKLYQQSNEIFEELGDKGGIANTLHQLGNIHYSQGNYKEAVKLYQQSNEIFEELGDKRGIAATLHQLGMIHQNQGNYEEAVKLYQRSMKIEEELGNKRGIAATLHQLGMIHQDQGNYEDAVKLYQQSMKIKEELGDKGGIATTLHQLGMIHQDQGNYEEAVKLYQQSKELFEELGDKGGIANTLGQLGNMHYSQGNYEEAVKLYQRSKELFEELGDKGGIANTLGQLGRVNEEHFEDYPAALEKYIMELMIFTELNSPMAELAKNDIARMKEKMGDETFNETIKDLRDRNGA